MYSTQRRLRYSRTIAPRDAGDRRYSVDDLLEPAPFAMEVADAMAIGDAERRQRHRGDEDAEPRRLIGGGEDREFQRGARLVPHAAVVGRQDAETIVAGRQIGVMRLTIVQRLAPLRILALQPVAESDFLGGDQAERRELDRDVPSQRRQLEARRGRVASIVDGDALDLHGGRQVIERQIPGIDDAHAVPGEEPDPAVGDLPTWGM